jgi:hypothetical protein
VKLFSSLKHNLLRPQPMCPTTPRHLLVHLPKSSVFGNCGVLCSAAALWRRSTVTDRPPSPSSIPAPQLCGRRPLPARAGYLLRRPEAGRGEASDARPLHCSHSSASRAGAEADQGRGVRSLICTTVGPSLLSQGRRVELARRPGHRERTSGGGLIVSVHFRDPCFLSFICGNSY